MYLSLCFVCPARFCELTDNTECSVVFLKNLVSPALDGVIPSAAIDTVMLNYSRREHMYYIHIRIQYHTLTADVEAPIEDTKVQLEGCVSQSLLQCFWEVNAFGC